MKSKALLALCSILGAATAGLLPGFAQDAPVPGGGLAQPMQPGQQQIAPLPGANKRRAPVPGNNAKLSYGDLPLNADDAKARIVELAGLVQTSRPQDLSDRVDQLCAWLTDMVDAHNKMANAFSKHDQMKAQSNAERQTAQRFARLKNQASLLKADLLISMRRYPEALVPLVDIVIAEPTTETGLGAYKRLQDLGFSPEVADASAPAATSAQAAAPSAKTAAASGNNRVIIMTPPKATPAAKAPKKTASAGAHH